MKRIALLLIMCFSLITYNYSQINFKDKLKKKTLQRADKRADQGIDKSLDKTEKGIKNLFMKDGSADEQEDDDKVKSDETNQSANSNAGSGNTNEVKDEEETASQLVWSKYDFVPGDKVIFEDNLVGEENGEFPSRWDLSRGNVEVAEFGGENVIMFRGGNPVIIPYLKNSKSDYLPDIFTVEFELYLPGNPFTVFLYDTKNQRAPSGSNTLRVWPTSMELYPAKSSLPNNETIDKKWAHIAIAFTNGKLKTYINETRLINIPHLQFDPTGISFNAYHASDHSRYYIKNIRIAEGGVKYYDRVLQDGKIVSNGIRFDVGKATLRPESMGVINEIYELMKGHPDLKFSVEGHTDSDGDEASNQSLSEERAETVMNTLVRMGIAKDRLSSKGFGESQPIDINSTAEGKANNRRVEFVKI